MFLVAQIGSQGGCIAAVEILALRAGLTMVCNTSNRTLAGNVIVGQHPVSPSSTAKQRRDVVVLADGRQHLQLQ